MLSIGETMQPALHVINCIYCVSTADHSAPEETSNTHTHIHRGGGRTQRWTDCQHSARDLISPLRWSASSKVFFPTVSAVDTEVYISGVSIPSLPVVMTKASMRERGKNLAKKYRLQAQAKKGSARSTTART